MKTIRLPLIAALLLAPFAVFAAEPMPVEDLGDGKYRIGKIELDKEAGWFEVPGRIIEQDSIDAPIEFLAVSKGGMKSYEAVIELDTTAIAFNTACILLGLDDEDATYPKYHFDPAEVKGDPVSLSLVLGTGEERRERPLLDLIRADGAPASGGWVYTGSQFTTDGRYLAEDFGTLIGVVHDPDSIIQHREGLGLGDYGAVVVNPDLQLGPGSDVAVRVERVD